MLYTSNGNRKYLTPKERDNFVECSFKQPSEIRSFSLLIAYSGCRLSEALAMEKRHIDLANGAVIIRSLKKRNRVVYRSVPIPHHILDLIATYAANNQCAFDEKIWKCGRTTAWKRLKAVMSQAGIFGDHACPKGLRHSFGITATQRGVPLNMIQKWLGHSRIETTSIYADAIGPEERQLAQRFWRSTN